jgi:hypothetical protein
MSYRSRDLITWTQGPTVTTDLEGNLWLAFGSFDGLGAGQGVDG